MLDLCSFFRPIDDELLNKQWQTTQFGFSVDKLADNYTPDLNSASLAIFNISEYEGTRNSLSSQNCYFRRAFYELHQNSTIKLVDLGRLILESTRKENFEIINQVCEELLKKNIIPIVLGGGNDIAYGIYRAYSNLNKYISLTSIDSSFDIGLEDDKLFSGSYFGKIMRHNPSFLFHFTNLGYQTHFVSPMAIKMLRNMNFDLIRLGNLKSNLSDVEPVMRNTDFLSFDISAIQSSFAGANIYSSPNGLNGDEACKIMHYAGLSDKLTSVGIFEYNQDLDNYHQTAKLLAQMLWYFVEGYKSRKNELNPNIKNCVKYTVAFDDGKNIIEFYKSKLSGRWWMGVPFKNDETNELQNYFVACSYNDYEVASKGEIPDKWLKTYNKFI